MANWAKLQEQLTGLRVVKRARHSIHFDKGNGEIVANFSGKPCHYQDTDGLWKPIDTKLLLLPDGFYGSPHSDVKIHKDGRVKAGGYQQKSTLVNAKEGVVDGDRIVREFEFGTQYLYMTEDGFRQETVITRPPTTQEAKFLIATETGKLPSKYKRSDITAVDADGAVHEFVNLGQFKKWLDKASYPVTIDPDFSVGNTTYGDFICEGSSDGNKKRNYGAATTFSISNYANSIFRYDLSSISADSTCTAVTFKITKTAGTSANTRTYYIYSLAAANADWIEGTQAGVQALSGEPCWYARKADGAGGVTEAWAGSGGCNTSGTDYESTALMSISQKSDASNPTQYEWNFNASGVARVQQWFGGITYNYGMMIKAAAYGESTFALSEHATASYRPVLSVTYTTGGALRRINMSSTQQLNGGANG